MKKKNGFTLVELLAVIVILAIIMVLSIPAVLDTMQSARRKTFKEFADKVILESQKKYLSDELLGNVSDMCILYDITNDLGLSNTGEFNGYVLIRKNINEVEYYITLWNNDYLVYGQKYDSDFDVDDISNVIVDDADVKTNGYLASVAGCESVSQINHGTNKYDNINVRDIYSGGIILGEYELNDSSKWEIGAISEETGELVESTDAIRTKDILKATTTDYLIVRTSQTGGYSYKTFIFEYDKDKKYLGNQYIDYEYGTTKISLKSNTKYVRLQNHVLYQSGETALNVIDGRGIEVHADYVKTMSSSKFKSAPDITDFNLSNVSSLIGGKYSSFGYESNSAAAIYDLAFNVEPNSNYFFWSGGFANGYVINVTEFDENYNYISETGGMLNWMDEYSTMGYKYTSSSNTRYVVIGMGNAWYSSATTYESIRNDFKSHGIAITKED